MCRARAREKGLSSGSSSAQPKFSVGRPGGRERRKNAPARTYRRTHCSKGVNLIRGPPSRHCARPVRCTVCELLAFFSRSRVYTFSLTEAAATSVLRASPSERERARSVTSTMRRARGSIPVLPSARAIIRLRNSERGDASVYISHGVFRGFLQPRRGPAPEGVFFGFWVGRCRLVARRIFRRDCLF